MRFMRLHADPDMVIVSPAYFKHYENKIKEEYPGMEIVVDSMVDPGWSYLANKEELTNSFKAKIEFKEEYEAKNKGSSGE